MYDPSKAADYWNGERLSKARNPLAAVLSFSQPDYVNEAYDLWESTIILRTLGDMHGKHVADVACGLGRMTVRLAAAGAEVHALDIAAGMLERTRAAGEAAGLSARIHLSLASATALPLGSASCDAAICAGLMEHLNADGRRDCLSEIARILKPGSTLVLVVNNAGSEYLRPAADNPYRTGVQYPSGYFCQLVEPQSITLELEALGFTVTRVAANLHYSHLRHAFRHHPETVTGPEAAMQEAVGKDLAGGLHGEEDDRFADHFILHCQLPLS